MDVRRAKKLGNALFPATQPQKIVHADLIKIRQRDKLIGCQRNDPGFVLRIGILGDM